MKGIYKKKWHIFPISQANATVDENLHNRCRGCYKEGISDIWIIRYLDEEQVKEEGK